MSVATSAPQETFMKNNQYPIHLWRCCVCALIMTLPGAQTMSAESRPTSTSGSPKRVMGLEKVIAFYGAYPELASQTFTRGGDWKYWQARGGIVSEGVVHYNFLRKNAAEAADVLVQMDFADNPNPVVNIDEFGWDYDGGIDQHTAAVLQAVHEKRPDLKITVWQMRGPVAPELAAVYRQTVELVLLETYFDLNDAWMIPFQLQAARLTGLLDQCVVALGSGQRKRGQGQLSVDPDGGRTRTTDPPDPLCRARVARRGVLWQVEAQGEQLSADGRTARRDLRPVPRDSHRRQWPRA